MRDKLINFKVSKEEKEKMKMASEKERMNLSLWLRKLALDKAEENVS